MYSLNLYCLYYQNQIVGRILPENYGQGDFQTEWKDGKIASETIEKSLNLK